jgi:hypothetical protein
MKRISLALFGCLILVTSALAADDSIPAELRVLIGTKLSPHVSEKGQIGRADIPNFISKNATGGSLSFLEGVFSEKWPAFVVTRDNKDMSVEILDIQMIPSKLLDWKFVAGKFKNIEGRFSLSNPCRASEDDDRWIVGLIKPEKGKADCGHNSKRIKQTWLIDQQTGHITPIASKGLQCYYMAIGSC